VDVELLLVSWCSHEQLAIVLLRTTTLDVGLSGLVCTSTVIDSQHEADRRRLPGSPTFLISGISGISRFRGVDPFAEPDPRGCPTPRRPVPGWTEMTARYEDSRAARRVAGPDIGRHRDQARSNRSRFMTLSHAATKSRTNFSFESSHA
jgi:hypothetical protein